MNKIFEIIQHPPLKALLFVTIALAYSISNASEKKPNILFIIADDLMKQIELYGNDAIQSPELKKLSEEALLFDRAYCQYPLYGPSRAALMLSKYPDNSGITWNQGGKSDYVQKKGEKLGVLTMPAYFKKNGYITVGGGKLYHNSVLPDKEDTLKDFTVALFNNGHDGKKKKITVNGKKKKSTMIVEASSKGVHEHKDGVVVQKAKEWLKKHSQSDSKQPFFMSIGIKKPHSPFSCPMQFFDKYQRENMEPSNTPIPNDILQHYSLSSPNALLKVHADTMNFTADTLPLEKQKEMVHGYYACVSYADYLVGDLIRSLKENGLYDNTIVIFTSDHGYKLGEYNRWAKFTLHEKDTVVPFLMRVPNKTESHGKTTNATIGLIDIYPTLAELCNIPVPEKIDGKSFVSSLNNPSTSERSHIRTVLPRAEGEDYPRGAGISVIHENGYRFTQWWEGELDSIPSKEEIDGFELYDHYDSNNTALSLNNIYKSKPELVNQMQLIASQK